MTYQMSNTLVAGETSFRIFRAGGSGLFNPKRIGWRFSERANTACRAGYWATYEILQDADESCRLYLRAVRCYGLEPIPEIREYPLLRGHAGHYDENSGSFAYSGMEIPVPFTGVLFVERGFPEHGGCRRTPDTPEDETRSYRFNDGLKTEAFRYPSEANRQIRAAPDLCDPYDLLETWPKPLTGSDAYRAFGKELVTGDRSPARMLRDSPYLKSTGHMLSEIVLPYLREVFEKASELDVPVKSVLAPQGFSSDIPREPLPPGE